MSKEEWLRRYRQAFIDEAQFSEEEADSWAAALSFEEASEGFEDDPEGAVIEEMSYWED